MTIYERVKIYERIKQKIAAQGLPPKEYERRIKKLAAKLHI